MSELIAEARVLVTPDTTTFRPLLTQQLAAITRTIPPVPVAITPVVTGTGTAGATAAAAAARSVAAAETDSAQAIRGATEARKAAEASTLSYTRRLHGLSTGAASAGLSLVGLRGATLAATGPFLAGAAGAIALGKGLQLATSFNSEIAVLGATTGATGEQLTVAAEAAREFGRDITLPGVTAGDAAKTITEFAKAGLDLNESIAATRGGLQLAQAAQLSYTDAVTLTANALNAFNLSGNQAVRVADTLANAANLAQGGIGDTALALRQAAGAAAVVGVSFEDTAALLTLLARNGLTGSDAGTALRTAFLRLVNPSDEAKEILQDLNVELRDINGNVRPEVFADFAAAQRNLATSAQQANAAIVFGQDAFRAFGFLGREGTEGLRQVQQGLDQTGTAARIAQARMVGLAGAQENLSNQLSDLGLTIGQITTPALEALVNELAEVVSGVNEAAGAVSELKGAFDDLPGPDTTDFFSALREDFTRGLELTQPAFRFIKAFKDGQEEVTETVENAGADIRSALEDSGRTAVQGARSFGDQMVQGLDAAFDAVNRALAEKQAEFRAAQLGAVRRGGGQQAGLEEVFDQIVSAGGSPQAQIANLRRQAEVQARIIRDAGPNAAGVLLEARRAAQARLASINGQIAQVEAQIAADQQRAQDEVRRVRDQAEQARQAATQDFLQQQAQARTRQENLITQAEDTPALGDDIRRTDQLRALIIRQIAQVRAQVSDERTRQAAILALNTARIATVAELRRLRQTNQEQIEEQRQAALDQVAENLSLRTQIAEARGNEGGILVALNAEIANQRKVVAAAKRARDGVLEAQLELEQLLAKRRDLLETAKEEADEQRGLTAFDILRQNAETFQRTGGNLITGNQPFAGPTGFTADVAQFLHRPATTVTMVEKPASSTERLQRQVNEQLARLVDALEQNTAAQTGNTSTVDQGQILGARANAMARFYLSRQARQITEAESP